MEANKEEAEKCIECAERLITEGKKNKAKKVLLKAERLFPTQKAKDLLEQLQTFQPQAEQEGEPRKRNVPKKQSDEQPQHTEHQQQSKPSASDKEFNKEHLEAVKRIAKYKDYYEILDVSKEATDSDIRKAYKKLALLLHPDKNKCPGAAEAFKAIGHAVEILTDPEKRKQYDLYGLDAESPQQAQRPTYADITLEELFRMFEAGLRNENVYTRRGGPWQHTENHGQNGEQQSIWNKVSLLVLLLIILIPTVLYFIPDPIYSLHKSSMFPVQRKTRNLKVPYFVKEDFHLDYKGRRKLEKSIEEEYVQRLQHSCQMEKSKHETLKRHARYSTDDLLRKVRTMRMPSCDELRDIEAQAG